MSSLTLSLFYKRFFSFALLTYQNDSYAFHPEAVDSNQLIGSVCPGTTAIKVRLCYSQLVVHGSEIVIPKNITTYY